MALTQVASGLIASVSGASLTGTQTIPRGTLPTGSVLQVVNGASSSQISTTSTSFITTGLTASITPTSATSKILIVVGLGDVSSENQTSNGVTIRLLRGASQIGANFSQQWCYNPTNVHSINSGSFNYLDSPATTSSTTYTVQFKAQGAGPTVAVMRDSTQGSITLMEIAA
jgi:hypothetical protein